MQWLQNIYQRCIRVVDALGPRVELDERSRFGDDGEQQAARLIAQVADEWVRGPLVPARAWYRMRESDFLVYTHGNLFCVEVKSMKGTLTYPLRSSSKEDAQQILGGYDKSMIVQSKQGKYGEGIFEQRYPHPLPKTESFIRTLKIYVSRQEPRFRGLRIIPVVCFLPCADISAIHNEEHGIIYLDELPAFFERHLHPHFYRRPTRWIIDTLRYKVPSWDWVLTTDNRWISGILSNDVLSFTNENGEEQQIPYKNVHTVSWQRGIFARYDRVVVGYLDRQQQEFRCVRGQLTLRRMEKEQVNLLRNVKQLYIGYSNKCIY